MVIKKITVFETLATFVAISMMVACGGKSLDYQKSASQTAALVLFEINKSFVAIPSGDFDMGCIEGDTACEDSEKPRHHRKIQSFEIMKHEITWGMYQPCIDAGVCKDNSGDGSFFVLVKENNPVVNVNWNEIKEDFIPWLNKNSQHTYRLPSEAEWEYAARAGSKTIYPWGNQASGTHANAGHKEGWPEDGFDKDVSPVMSYPANDFGLYDMAGNVFEWVEDCWYKDAYQNSSGTGLPNTDEGECKRKVARGGSYNLSGQYLRTSSRYYLFASSRFSDIGFRLVRESKAN